jgi:hypothetical protein
MTATLSDRFEMYGNGCAGSTASGVEHREDLLEEHLAERLAVLVREVRPADHRDVLGGEPRADPVGPLPLGPARRARRPAREPR